ncbi:MAG: Holliday junction branch migration protein RuvA [bacterium]|nr:Holliday junction branch migration protein RuvA [bacterium]
MISHIRGDVLLKTEKFAVLETGGLGYKVYATKETLDCLSENKSASLWTYLAVREDSNTLYGFLQKDELDFFELLLTVSGIGPKTALGILNLADVSSIKKAVSANNPAHLIKVSGIGKRVAEKIVLELKNKIKGEAEPTLKEEIEAMEALKSLGYSQKESREALRETEGVTTINEKIKQALKILGK